MAELIASVLTIAQAVFVAFEKSQKALAYIEEVRSIKEPISDLLTKVRDIERLTRTVKSTYAQAEPNVPSNSKSLRQIRKALVACQERLENLKLLAFSLAFLKSTTWREKYTIKRRMDSFMDKIKALERGIQWDYQMLQSGLSCLSLEVNTTRCTFPPLESPGLIPAPMPPRISNEETVSPISPSRTLLDAETVFGPDPDLQLLSSSTFPSYTPRPSISSASSLAPPRSSDRNDSVVSATELTPLSTKHDWKDFEFHIFKRGASEDSTQEIREILQEHADGIALARFKDPSGRTPLHAAAQHGDVDLARVLIDEYRANINAQDSRGHSVLDLAVKHRDFVALLLERGVDEAALSSKYNEDRFKAMKRTILREKARIPERTRTMSRSERSGLAT